MKEDSRGYVQVYTDACPSAAVISQPSGRTGWDTASDGDRWSRTGPLNRSRNVLCSGIAALRDLARRTVRREPERREGGGRGKDQRIRSTCGWGVFWGGGPVVLTSCQISTVAPLIGCPSASKTRPKSRV